LAFPAARPVFTGNLQVSVPVELKFITYTQKAFLSNESAVKYPDLPVGEREVRLVE
jgi:hypothetical protein